MSIILDKKQCLIAGDGELPVAMAESAQKNGFEVVAISLSSDNRNKLKKYCSKVYNFGPGEVSKIKQTLIDEKVTEDIDGLTPENLYEFYQNILNTSKVDIFMSGSITDSMVNEVKNILAPCFSPRNADYVKSEIAE